MGAPSRRGTLRPYAKMRLTSLIGHYHHSTLIPSAAMLALRVSTLTGSGRAARQLDKPLPSRLLRGGFQEMVAKI